MSNDKDDNFDHEESEYHFSDDDTGYEIEPDATKSAAPVARENMLARLTSSKRMLISIGVFLVLVFVAYKLVSPSTSTAPSTDIATTTATPTQQMQTQMPTVAANQQQMQQPVVQQTIPVAPVMQTAQTAPVSNSGLPPQSSIVPQTLPPQSTVIQQPQMQQAAAPMQQQQTYQPQPQTVTTMPVQSIAADGTQTGQQGQPVGMPQVDPNAVAANSDRAIAQVQADYQQKLSDYSVQNKAILDQLQALAAKVATIENQLNVMTQNVARPNPLMGPSSSAAPASVAIPMSMSSPAASPAEEAGPTIAYNVQAIIPGRAWLKSESGETVTVAEGDVVRDLGRISKIDPYDGIVEINTGRKVITLSYGNVG